MPMRETQVKFSLGEVAVFVLPGSSAYGKELTIASELRRFHMISEDGERMLTEGYLVTADWLSSKEGTPWCAPHKYLSKRPPKQDWMKIITMELPNNDRL